MTKEMQEHIRRKEEAYLARKAGLPIEQLPVKKYWWEIEDEKGGQ
jgi:hypothetical protein